GRPCTAPARAVVSGSAFSSTLLTRTPRRVSHRANTRPVGPAPTMRTSVSRIDDDLSRRRRSEPAPNALLVSDIVLAKLSLQIPFLAFNDRALHHDQDQGEQHETPPCPSENGHPGVAKGKSQVQRVSGKAERSGHDERGGRDHRIDTRSRSPEGEDRGNANEIGRAHV